MTFSDVRVVDHGWFRPSRCYLETFNEQNDTGIRCHHWLTAFFFRIFGLVHTIKTAEGKSIHLNKNSLKAWIERNQPAEGGRLPTPAEIIQHKKQKIDEIRSRQKEIEVLRSTIAELEAKQKETPIQTQLQVKKEEEAIQKYEASIQALRMQLIGEQKAVKAPSMLWKKNEREAKKKNINDLESQIEINKGLVKATSEAVTELRKEEIQALKEIETELAKLRAELKIKEGITAPLPVQEKASDLFKLAHPKLQELMQTLFDKFEPGFVKKWSYDLATQEFRIDLAKTATLWIRQTDDKGEPDPTTPKGVILLFGNNQEACITGTLSENQIALGEGSFATYCEFRNGVNGKANGKVNSIVFDPNTNILSVKGTGKAQGLGWLAGDQPVLDVKDIALVQRNWSKGIVTPDSIPYQKYLGNELFREPTL